MKHTEFRPPKNLPAQLAEPHFDEETIANAQPVEPLATVNRWPAEWATRRTVVSTAAMIVLAVGMAATLSLGAVLFKLHQSNALATDTEVTSTQAIEDETAGTSKASVQNETTQKPKPRKMKVFVPDNQPVARRVGVIYGR